MKHNPQIVAQTFKTCGLPKPTFEFRFHPVRRWRFDIAFVEHKVYVEVDGGIWINGAHSRGAQIKKDWEKRNTAAGMGWRGILCEPKDLLMSDTIEMIREALTYRPE